MTNYDRNPDECPLCMSTKEHWKERATEWGTTTPLERWMQLYNSWLREERRSSLFAMRQTQQQLVLMSAADELRRLAEMLEAACMEKKP